jgi:DNA-directed RNA polymerase subunit alpha
MSNIDLPSKFSINKISPNQSIVTIEPCYPGYGTTIGNALRRVLISSLPGSAVVAVKIKGATHEFSTIHGVKEDVVEIIMNMKLIRFKLHNQEEAKVTLKIKGEKDVKAKDIKVTSDVEVINQEAHIATLTDKSAELEMEIYIASGRGYLPVESMEKKKLELGVITVDAVFTPVRNVNFDVENVRVGQMTNYERLKLGVTTDGTITPEEATKIAAQILFNHFNFIVSSTGEKVKEEKKEKKEEKTVVTEEVEKAKKKRGRPKKEE